MRILSLLFFLLILLVGFGHAQETDWRLYQSADSTTPYPYAPDSILSPPLKVGEVAIYNPYKLDSLLSYLELYPPDLKGYRVLVFLGTSRSEADRIRSLCLQKQLNYPIYFQFKDPNFSVEVGDFFTRLQAEKALEELNQGFKNPYVVLRTINKPEMND